jgi:hypothetical protein
MHNAIKMLNGKIKNLTAYLHAVEKGNFNLFSLSLSLMFTSEGCADNGGTLACR